MRLHKSRTICTNMDVVFKFLQNTNTIPSFMMISLAFTEKCRRSPGWSKTATGHTSRRDGGTFSDVQPKSKLPILRKKRRITKFDYSFHLLQVSIECLVSVSFVGQMMMVNC